MLKTFTRSVMCTLLAATAMLTTDAFAATYIPYSPTGMTARQSSALNAGTSAGAVARAIDGNLAGNPAGWDDGFLVGTSGNRTQTNADLDYDINWWVVDLGKETAIDQVKIFFLNGDVPATQFKVEYFAADPTTAGVTAVHSTEVTANAETNCTVTEANTVKARYVRLNFKEAKNPQWGIRFTEVQFLKDVDGYTNTSIASKYENPRLYKDVAAAIPLVFKGDKDGVTEIIELANSACEISNLSDGLTYTNGLFTTSQAGEFSFDAAYKYDATNSYTGSITGTAVEMGSCLTSATGTTATFEPNTGLFNGDASALFDENAETQYGWGDGGLGTADDPKTPAYITIDLKGKCEIEAIKLAAHAQIHATDYKVEVFDNLANSALASHSVAGNTETVNTWILDNPVVGRYVKITVNDIANYAWGHRYDEICVYGTQKEAVAPTAIKLNVTEGQTLYAYMGYSFDATVTYNDGTEANITDYTVTNLPAGLTYENGTFTASAAGTYNFTIGTGDVTASASLTFEGLGDCLTFANGAATATVTRVPGEENLKGNLNATVFFDPNGGAHDEFGWANANIIDFEKTYYDIDLGGLNKVNFVQIRHSGAAISKYTLKFYGNDGTTEIDSYAGTNTAGQKEWSQYIQFETPVDGVRYIRMYVNANSENKDWGACLKGFSAFGEKEAAKAIALDVAADKTLYANVDYSFDATVTLSDESTVKTAEYTVSELPEGLTYENGKFKAAAAGTYKFKIAASGVTGDAELTFKALGNCLAMGDGIHSTTVTFSPNENMTTGAGQVPGALFDENPETSYGWTNNGLGESNDLTANPATITIDLKRNCEIQAVKAVTATNTFATDYVVEVYSSLEADPVATYTVTDNNVDENLCIFDKSVEGRYVKLTINKINVATYGHVYNEICVLGASKEEINAENIELRATNKRHFITYNTNDNEGKLSLTVTAGLFDKTTGEQVAELKDFNLNWISAASASEERPFYDDYTAKINWNAETKVFTVEQAQEIKSTKGRYSYFLTYTDPSLNKTFESATEVLEVATGNWTDEFNIARKYKAMLPNDLYKNGRGKGNYAAKAYHNSLSHGAPNQGIEGLIDGDWMAWDISTKEMNARAGESPAIYLDFGFPVKIDEVNIHFNANANVPENDPNYYAMMLGKYRMYGGNFKEGKEFETSRPSDMELAENIEWTAEPIFDVDGYDENYYGGPDRHVFEAKEYQFLKFEFYAPEREGVNVSINEITVGGPEFLTAEGQPNTEKYENTRGLSLKTPTFDRSNVADRSVDNDWIVTSSRVNEANHLLISYLAVDILGEDFTPNDLKLTYTNTYADGKTESGELVKRAEDVNYRDIAWKAYPFIWNEANQTGTSVIKIESAKYKDTDPLTVHVISTRANINRYAYCYDNAHNYSPNWNAETPDKSGERDLSALGTAPQNASDGQYGSWYVIGYYGPGESMGQTYKWAADELLAEPKELVFDYRGENGGDTPELYAKELDMVGIQYEGAFPRDYKAYILPMEENEGKMTVKKNADGSDAWEEVAVFTGMTSMGIGQNETHRIYPADPTTGEPLYQTENPTEIEPWKNVAAFKLVFERPGTPYGIKLFESAIYGQLNMPVVPTLLRQAHYTTAEATEENPEGYYYGFDLVASLDLTESVLKEQGENVPERVKESIKNVDSYNIVLTRKSFNAESGKFEDAPFNTSNADNDHPSFEGGKVDTDGKFKFNVKNTQNTEAAELVANTIVIKDVDPTKYYSFEAIPVLKEETGETLKVIASPEAQIIVPGAQFDMLEATLEAQDGEITGVSHNDEALSDAHHHGSVAGKHQATYTKGNVFGVKGVMNALAVTNDVLDKYDVVLNIAPNAFGEEYAFTHRFGAESKSKVNAAEKPAVALSYLPMETDVKTVAELGIELPDGTPEAIKAKKVVVASIPEKLSATVSGDVKYERRNSTLKAEAKINAPVIVDDNKPAISGISEKLAALDGTVRSDLRLEKSEGQPYNAFIGMTLNVGAGLNSFPGFYATNDYHESNIQESEYKGGRPFGENEVYFGIKEYDWSSDNGADNFAHKAMESGRLGVYLQKVAAETTSAEDVINEKVYLFTTNEYPILLSRPNTEGVLGEAYPTFVMSYGEENVEFVKPAAPAAAMLRAAAAGDNVQPLSVPDVKLVEFTDSKVIPTSVENLTDDANGLNVYPNPADSYVNVAAQKALGSVAIYSMDGKLVKSVDTNDSKVTVDVTNLSTGVYVVRAAGETARMIKK